VLPPIAYRIRRILVILRLVGFICQANVEVINDGNLIRRSCRFSRCWEAAIFLVGGLRVFFGWDEIFNAKDKTLVTDDLCKYVGIL